jgi:hypothetical protein
MTSRTRGTCVQHCTQACPPSACSTATASAVHSCRTTGGTPHSSVKGYNARIHARKTHTLYQLNKPALGAVRWEPRHILPSCAQNLPVHTQAQSTADGKAAKQTMAHVNTTLLVNLVEPPSHIATHAAYPAGTQRCTAATRRTRAPHTNTSADSACIQQLRQCRQHTWRSQHAQLRKKT